MRRTLAVLSFAVVWMIFGLAVILNGAACWAQNQHSSRVSLPDDWSTRHLVFSGKQATNPSKSHPDLRYYQQWARRNDLSLRNSGAQFPSIQSMRLAAARFVGERGPQRRPSPKPKASSATRDWSYYLGATAGAASAPSIFPAKFTFDVNAAPSCTNDYVAFPVNKSGSSSQASLVAFNNLYAGPIVAASQTGTFTGRPNNGQTVTITNGTFNITLTASSTSNLGSNFQRSTNTSVDATNLAAAITRNGATVGVSAISAGAVVTVTALTTGTGGNSITLAEGLNGFTWAGTTLAGGAGSFCSVSAPSVMWSYNAATTPVLTSPVVSVDGTAILFVEQGTSGAVLHVLKWKSGEGTAPDVPTVPDQSINSTDVGAATAWSTCLGDITKSCMFNVQFANGANDSNSSPFYDYARDVLYVGDDGGTLHKFTGLFYSTPAEVTTGNWPITVHSGSVLTSPVFEVNSGNIFVGDSNGQLSYVRETISSVGTCQGAGATPCLGSTVQALGGPIVDAPLVDGSTGRVFAFEGTDTTNNGTVFQFDTALSAASMLSVKVGTYFAGYRQSYMHAGTFDNGYYNSPSGTGYLYVCGKNTANNRYDSPALHRIAITNGLMNTTSDGSLTLTSASGEECSPVTEIYNSNTGVDWLFFSVGNRASQTGCGTAGCVMSLNLTALGATWPPPAVSATYPTPVGPVNATTNTNESSTSAIVVDNVSTAEQASSLYFTTTSTTTCGTTGGGNVSGCAVKLTQSGLQ